jgi:hypothetical protein
MVVVIFPEADHIYMRKEKVKEMLIYKGGQKVGKGAYWDLRNGRRIYVGKEGMLPGYDASTYLRMPAWGMLLSGPIIGMLYAVLFPFIGIAVVLMAAGHRVAESVVSLVGKSLSFHWRPRDAYLTGKKKEKPKEKSDKK